MVLHSCRITLATFVAILSLGTSVERARAATIVGAGTSVFDELVDTPNTGGRINVDNTTAIFLTAGSYIATLFSFDAGQPGDVTPFLAVETLPNVFTAIAVGATQNLLGYRARHHRALWRCGGFYSRDGFDDLRGHQQ